MQEEESGVTTEVSKGDWFCCYCCFCFGVVLVMDPGPSSVWAPAPSLSFALALRVIFKLKPSDSQLVQKAFPISSVAEGTSLWEQAHQIPFQWNFSACKEAKVGPLELHKQTFQLGFLLSSVNSLVLPWGPFLPLATCWTTPHLGLFGKTFSRVLMHSWIKIPLLLLICLCYFSPQASKPEPQGAMEKFSFSQL